jgi:hypothetical protein
MKKFLVLALVLSMATMANAGLVLSASSTEVLPSQIITISVVETGPLGVLGFSVDVITDGAPDGVASNGVLNATWEKKYPGTLNTNGFLSELWSATQLTVNPVTGAVLYTFDYHVPNLPASTWITIQSFDDGGDNYFAPEVAYVGGSKWTGPLSTQIHIIPEPMTMCLLGLGGLFLRRRSK